MPPELKEQMHAESTRLPLCGVSIASFVLAFLSLMPILNAALSSSDVPGPLSLAGAFGLLVAFFLGINSIIRVCRRTASAWSLFFAIPPVLAPAILMACGILWLNEANSRLWCNHHLADLSYDLIQYCDNNNERYPDPNKWCDLLMAKPEANPNNLRCPRDKIGPCSYALNPGATPASRGDTVLLFESKQGWNQHGGPDLLDPSRHWPRGCHVLRSDLYVEFVPERDLPKLRWATDEPPRK